MYNTLLDTTTLAIGMPIKPLMCLHYNSRKNGSIHFTYDYIRYYHNELHSKSLDSSTKIHSAL